MHSLLASFYFLLFMAFRISGRLYSFLFTLLSFLSFFTFFSRDSLNQSPIFKNVSLPILFLSPTVLVFRLYCTGLLNIYLLRVYKPFFMPFSVCVSIFLKLGTFRLFYKYIALRLRVFIAIFTHFFYWLYYESVSLPPCAGGHTFLPTFLRTLIGILFRFKVWLYGVLLVTFGNSVNSFHFYLYCIFLFTIYLYFQDLLYSFLFSVPEGLEFTTFNRLELFVDSLPISRNPWVPTAPFEKYELKNYKLFLLFHHFVCTRGDYPYTVPLVNSVLLRSLHNIFVTLTPRTYVIPAYTSIMDPSNYSFYDFMVLYNPRFYLYQYVYKRTEPAHISLYCSFGDSSTVESDFFFLDLRDFYISTILHYFL